MIRMPDRVLFFSFGGQQFEVKGEKGSIVIPPSKWKNLLESAAGDSIQVTVQSETRQ